MNYYRFGFLFIAFFCSSACLANLKITETPNDIIVNIEGEVRLYDVLEFVDLPNDFCVVGAELIFKTQSRESFRKYQTALVSLSERLSTAVLTSNNELAYEIKQWINLLKRVEVRDRIIVKNWNPDLILTSPNLDYILNQGDQIIFKRCNNTIYSWKDGQVVSLDYKALLPLDKYILMYTNFNRNRDMCVIQSNGEFKSIDVGIHSRQEYFLYSDSFIFPCPTFLDNLDDGSRSAFLYMLSVARWRSLT